MFFHRDVFIIEMFFNAVVDELCQATNVLLIAAVTREVIRDRASVSSAFALRGGVG